MSLAEQWTPEELRARRAIARSGLHVNASADLVGVLNRKRAEQAKVVFCAAAIAHQLDRR